MSNAKFGKYRLIAELGHGGMADVFMAVSMGPAGLGFNKLVVIKRLREHLANDQEFVAMLIDEARIAARLNHPNVVQTIEIGEEDGTYYIAMEYLDGQPLKRITRADRAALPRNMHYGIMADVLAGLHHAHELADFDNQPLQVVHRDVTPHNVFVTYNGQTKVVDFGVAKAIGRASETRAGIVKGKAAYMAPEQARGLPVDRRADLFAVGIMLWEAATGTRMWPKGPDVDILRKLIRGELAPSARTVNPEVPDRIDQICAKALAASPADRYATAADFQADIEEFLVKTGQKASARQVGVFLSNSFKDKRAKTKEIIEHQLASLKSTASVPVSIQSLPKGAESGTIPSVTQPSGAPPAEAPLAIVEEDTPNRSGPLSPRTSDAPSSKSDPGKQGSGPSAISLSPPSQAPPPARSYTRLMLLVGIGAVALAALVVALTNRPADGVGTGTPAAMDAALGEPAAPVLVAIALRGSPADIQFQIDDGPKVANPYVGRVTKDGKEHTVRAEATGFLPRVEKVTFNDEVSIRVFLAKAPVDAGKKGK
jgi:serine/threonine protein kinase